MGSGAGDCMVGGGVVGCRVEVVVILGGGGGLGGIWGAWCAGEGCWEEEQVGGHRGWSKGCQACRRHFFSMWVVGGLLGWVVGVVVVLGCGVGDGGVDSDGGEYG